MSRGDRRVTSLHVYPFKSASGIAVDEVEVDRAGLRDDRRWMIVDAEGDFVSQRTHPRMALLRTRWTDAGIAIETPDGAVLQLDRPGEGRGTGDVESVRVWFSDRRAVDCGAEAAAWASDFLEMPCRVVRAVRPATGASITGADRADPNPSDALTPDGYLRTGFADGYPALVVSRASLDELNRRLDVPLPMDRFRPNIVVEGFRPHEEDDWGRRRIGRVATRGRKPCPRCATTLVDQATGEKGVEPLRTFATYRRNAEGEVDFGMNILFDETGTIRVGDRVG